MSHARLLCRQGILSLERQALGGLDMVIGHLDSALDALSGGDAEPAAIVVSPTTMRRRALPGSPSGLLSLLAPRRRS